MRWIELSRPITEIKGIGEQKKKQLAKISIETVADLLQWFPRGWEDRTRQVPFSEVMRAGHGFVVTRVTVVSLQHFGGGFKKTLKVIVKDSTGTAELICFGRNFLADQLIPGNQYHLAGEFQYRYNALQSTRFEFEPIPQIANLNGEESHNSNFGRILPIYPLSGNLTQAFFRTTLGKTIKAFLYTIDDDLPQSIRENHQLQEIKIALKNIHQPESATALEQALRSLKFREFFYFQKVAIDRRQARLTQTFAPLHPDLLLQEALINRLPFQLTPDQKKVITEINQDIVQPHPMARLLQGDVGCGKTLVAIAVALQVISNNKQVALLVPTELLAQQHAENIAKLLHPLGVRLALLTGKLSQTARRPLLQALKEGEIDIVIGTHTLFTTSVQFKELKLVIIDEQHKFGVHQREAMEQKGVHPHLLLMSATPIPRTLAMTVYGDLKISEIKTTPQGRLPIITHLAKEENSEKVYKRVIQELNAGHQAYFIYPRIGEEENLDEKKVKSATQSYQELTEKWFRHYNCALLHSETPEEEKETIMNEFNKGEIDLLIATTIVEVGIDNPNASAIVIEEAQQFGMATLHQLRGRVGRGTTQSYCFLIYKEGITEEAGQRLMALKNETDGFRIAEEDLKLRGAGELLGSRQSGQFYFQLANPLTDSHLLTEVTQALIHPEN